jgi:2-polyprenyl-6-methoxyphenol hydroxylase-like FAD-dependent oxidoreductase
MSRRHAEIVGAGLAGLTAAVALAQRGWSVRLHESHSSLRREGFGITIHANGLRVLAALGARDEATRNGVQLGFSELRDSSNAVIARTRLDARACRLSRFALVSALAEQARVAGVEICFASTAIAARPDGNLELENGRRYPADLIVAADGIASPVRDSLGLIRSQKLLPDGAQRLLIPRQTEEPMLGDGNTVIEWWSGTRRIIFGACSPQDIYLALSCRRDDVRARQVPIDLEAWTQAFPPLAGLLGRVLRDADWSTTMWAQFMLIKLKRWSSGRVAIIGDAAHAMPPNLGQGGSCAMMGALSLAAHLERTADIPQALHNWEMQERPLIEHTQRWSRLYSVLAAWPRIFSGPVLALLALPRFKRQYRRVASHIPTGT